MHSNSKQEKLEQHVGQAGEILLIALDRIHILNPRSRNRAVFARLVENIATIGLKRPVTVVESGAHDSGPRYELICGQGRYEAMQALGETSIPCVVVQAAETERYLISLVENIARRKHSNQDLLEAVRTLEERGYSVAEIARKTSLDPAYISCILYLLKNGEERLIGAVEKGWLSIDLASKISRSGEADIQLAMMEAYEKKLLNGDQLMRVKRLINQRQAMGKQYGKWTRRDDKPSPQKLLQTYQAEANRKRLIIRKADVNEQRLLFVVSAFRKLLADEHFRTLLRAEGFADMPKPLADRLHGQHQS